MEPRKGYRQSNRRRLTWIDLNCFNENVWFSEPKWLKSGDFPMQGDINDTLSPQSLELKTNGISLITVESIIRTNETCCGLM